MSTESLKTEFLIRPLLINVKVQYGNFVQVVLNYGSWRQILYDIVRDTDVVKIPSHVYTYLLFI